jgi:hypothetical protein
LLKLFDKLTGASSFNSELLSGLLCPPKSPIDCCVVGVLPESSLLEAFYGGEQGGETGPALKEVGEQSLDSPGWKYAKG